MTKKNFFPFVNIIFIIIIFLIGNSNFKCERSPSDKDELEKKDFEERFEKYREKIFHKIVNNTLVFYSNKNYFAININFIQLEEVNKTSSLNIKPKIMWEIEIKNGVNSFHPDSILYGKPLKEFKVRVAPKKLSRGKKYRLIVLNISPYIDPLVYNFTY